MARDGDVRNSYDYRKKAKRFKDKARRNGWPCYYCKKPFDWTLDPSHGMAFTADHIEPIAVGGHVMGSLRPAHRSCNSRRGDGQRERRAPTTRDW